MDLMDLFSQKVESNAGFIFERFLIGISVWPGFLPHTRTTTPRFWYDLFQSFSKTPGTDKSLLSPCEYL